MVREAKRNATDKRDIDIPYFFLWTKDDQQGTPVFTCPAHGGFHNEKEKTNEEGKTVDQIADQFSELSEDERKNIRSTLQKGMESLWEAAHNKYSPPGAIWQITSDIKNLLVPSESEDNVYVNYQWPSPGYVDPLYPKIGYATIVRSGSADSDEWLIGTGVYTRGTISAWQEGAAGAAPHISPHFHTMPKASGKDAF